MTKHSHRRPHRRPPPAPPGPPVPPALPTPTPRARRRARRRRESAATSLRGAGSSTRSSPDPPRYANRPSQTRRRSTLTPTRRETSANSPRNLRGGPKPHHEPNPGASAHAHPHPNHMILILILVLPLTRSGHRGAAARGGARLHLRGEIKADHPARPRPEGVAAARRRRGVRACRSSVTASRNHLASRAPRRRSTRSTSGATCRGTCT